LVVVVNIASAAADGPMPIANVVGLSLLGDGGGGICCHFLLLIVVVFFGVGHFGHFRHCCWLLPGT
jgi:hypothetical protein